MTCKICHRQAEESGYCRLHAKAYRSVVKNYVFWEKALGIAWKEYLSEIAENLLTGEWSKEVAKHLASKGDMDYGKIS